MKKTLSIIGIIIALISIIIGVNWVSTLNSSENRQKIEIAKQNIKQAEENIKVMKENESKLSEEEKKVMIENEKEIEQYKRKLSSVSYITYLPIILGLVIGFISYWFGFRK